LQVWHRAILPGDSLEPYGVLLCVAGALAGNSPLSEEAMYRTQLVKKVEGPFNLALEVGGGQSLVFCRS
jgi:hypothetical protein